MMGEANDVPPAPAHLLGAPVQLAPPFALVGIADHVIVAPQSIAGEQRNVRNIAHAVAGIPSVCHEGLAYALHVPLTTPAVDGDPGGAAARTAAAARDGQQPVCRSGGTAAEAAAPYGAVYPK